MDRLWKTREPQALQSEALRSFSQLSPIAIQLCSNRGVLTTEEIEKYFRPKLEHLKDPFCLKDMDVACARVKRVVELGEKVGVFGDYDVDGTTGAALLSYGFDEFGIQRITKQPNRFTDGYGLSLKAVREFNDEGVKVIVTVDCGITGFTQIEEAQKLGMDVIVLDHHQVDPERGIPKALAVVDPQREDCESGLRELCGCGVAFYFLRALRRTLDRNIPLKRHLDLVVMATAADLVPLIGDNHILLRHGMEILQSTQKPGVKSLLEVSGLAHRAKLSPSSLGFAIGPRINASGRMGSASRALDLLMQRDSSIAARQAFELEAMNLERQKIQEQVWLAAKAQADEKIQLSRCTNAIVVASEDFHEGVVGIVASRLVDFFQRPACVISLHEGKAKGSLRSYAGKDVLEGLRRSASHLLSFGGHRHAAGVQLERDNVDQFEKAFDEAMFELSSDENLRPLWVDMQVTLEELSHEVFQEIESMAPFGPGNPEPLLLVRAQCSAISVLKDKHYKFNLKSPENVGVAIEAIYFQASDRFEVQDLEKNTGYWLVTPEFNRFRGKTDRVLRVKDFKPFWDSSK